MSIQSELSDCLIANIILNLPAKYGMTSNELIPATYILSAKVRRIERQRGTVNRDHITQLATLVAKEYKSFREGVGQDPSDIASREHYAARNPWIKYCWDAYTDGHITDSEFNEMQSILE